MDKEHPSVSMVEVLKCWVTPLFQVREGQGMLSSQSVVPKASRGLLTSMHLSMLSDPVQLSEIFKNTFSLTKRPFIS